MSQLLGITAGLSSSLLWAWSSVRFQAVIADHGPFAINFFKAAVGMLLFWATLAVLLVTTSVGLPDAGDALLLLASGLVGMAFGDYAFFAALRSVGVRRATLLHATAPLFLLVWSFTSAGTSLDVWQVAGVLLVVAGVMDVVRPRGGAPRASASGVAWGLTAALGQAAGIAIVSDVMGRVHALPASALRLTGACAGLALLLLVSGRIGRAAATLGSRALWRRGLPAVLAGTYLGIVFMMVAVANAPEAVAGALLSLTPVFALPVTRWLLAEPIGLRALAGTVLATAGVVVLGIAGAASP